MKEKTTLEVKESNLPAAKKFTFSLKVFLLLNSWSNCPRLGLQPYEGDVDIAFQVMCERK
jgi:hypothetical protein